MLPIYLYRQIFPIDAATFHKTVEKNALYELQFSFF